jgi:metallo-beta-lactamase class B
MHTSFLQTQDFGNVPCNGLVVTRDQQAIIFDTPTNNESAEELIKWIDQHLHARINAIIPTHFHNDCLGGLQLFHDRKIPSYASIKTIELAKQNEYPIPQNGFTDSLVLPLGKEQVITRFMGAGHTRDNVIGYFPLDEVMFGGCLIKELGANKGYLGDADTLAWPATVKKIQQQFPKARTIIPGHGKPGDQQLLNYTIQLFQ